jgi:two-component sensor histidine kinase
MKASLDQKMMLLQEIHHRVKNNLAIVSGLLRMQSAAITDEKVLSFFEEAESRILSMALVHDSLYRSKNFAGVDAESHIRNLASQILRNSIPGVEISLEVDGGGVFLDLEKAIPCSLILNELIINSIKYAFAGRSKGCISITVASHEGSSASLTYRDDGVGIPTDLDLATVKSLGMRLIWNLMTVQLKGTVEVRKDHGTMIVMKFPLSKGKPKRGEACPINESLSSKTK